MMSRGWGLPTISLDELNETTSLLTRHDRKYIVEPDMVDRLMEEAARELKILEVGGQRVTPYRSTYFDTPDLISYRAAATSRRRRFKVRTRHYGDDPLGWLEVKVRSGRGHTIKQRVQLTGDGGAGPMATLDDRAMEFLSGFTEIAPHVGRLEATMVTTYDRATLATTGPVATGQRITVDRNLRAHLIDGSPVDLGGLPEMAIIEAKSATEHPGTFDRTLWRAGRRPVSMSKYAISMARAHPGLAHNKWHRTIARHVSQAQLQVKAESPARCFL